MPFSSASSGRSRTNPLSVSAPETKIRTRDKLLRYFLSRLAWAFPIVLAILILNFLIVHLVPGDPVQALVGDFPAPPDTSSRCATSSASTSRSRRSSWLYLENLAQGNLGFSFANRQPVLDLILDRARLDAAADDAGARPRRDPRHRARPRRRAARRQRCDSGDHRAQPPRLLGADLLARRSCWSSPSPIQLGWLPAQGMMTLRDRRQGFGRGARRALAPRAAGLQRHDLLRRRSSRASRAPASLEALHQDFVLTAKAKGLSRRTILWRHVLPNAMIPVVTVIGYNFGYSLTGAILVETVFAWPGPRQPLHHLDRQPRLSGAAGHLPLHGADRRASPTSRPTCSTAALDPRVRPSYARQCVGSCGRLICALIARRTASRALSSCCCSSCSRSLRRSCCRARSARDHRTRWSAAVARRTVLGTDELGRDVLAGILLRHPGVAHRRLPRRARRRRCSACSSARSPGFYGGLARPRGHAHLRDLPGDAELHPGRRHRRDVRPRPHAGHRGHRAARLAADGARHARRGHAREAARVRRRRALPRHREGTILAEGDHPQRVAPVLAVGTLIVGQAILLEASLSFLGLSQPRPRQLGPHAQQRPALSSSTPGGCRSFRASHLRDRARLQPARRRGRRGAQSARRRLSACRACIDARQPPSSRSTGCASATRRAAASSRAVEERDAHRSAKARRWRSSAKAAPGKSTVARAALGLLPERIAAHRRRAAS